ncbi:MAG: glycoside hydrolase family 3 C-terminal domain-containing protein [Bacteroidota bacterium]|nr:glycoside hydrolase family 3 C-terminal domain-containing protein [Bacteroidota bacterium]
MEQRVDELIKQMTLEEKVSQMMNDAPAIERLGVPSYNWWNECLHGVARAGLATVYPQAIALAATFDDEALKQSASLISDEAVAKHYEFVRQGHHAIYQGLTFWSPNINIFRDPRWGRGQETYGEDPFLTSKMGVAFVEGLQGDNPDYYKLIATAKHFAVHSGPESDRHTIDVQPGKFDLYDTYLPAFKALVQKAKVASVMCAYNRLDGRPCCGNGSLLTDILRNDWGFNGYIVSDCGAIDDFYRTHKSSANAVEASAQAVRAGTDLECGNTYQSIIQAIHDGYLSEKDIDKSLHRLFTARFRLGLFSPPDKIPYAGIPYSVVDSKAHRDDALTMARKSIVLLKNEQSILPLSKNLREIAVIGPCAEDSVSLLGNYNGTPGKAVTILQGIKEKLGNSVEVIYRKGINLLNDSIFYPVDSRHMLFNHKENGFKAEYFGNIKLEGPPVYSRIEKNIDFSGDVTDEIAPGVKASWMSARWTAVFMPDTTVNFTFNVSGDDGFRLFIDDRKVIDHYSYHEEMADSYTFPVVKGKKYSLRLEYFQGDQRAAIHLQGGIIKVTDYTALAKEVSDADAIIFSGGISPSLEGEEMPVSLPGFDHGDRTTTALPEVQTRLMKALVETGKPVIFVMQTGSSLAVNWEKAHVPAILNVWYDGQATGTAVADVLFGDYNPAGRLPVTFYKSDKDIPPFDDYSMKGRTYRYFDGKPLFPFGYGLSYTTFRYSALTMPHKAKTGERIAISVTIKNTGSSDGDGVIQLYVTQKKSGYTVPRCALKGFKRLFLRKNEEKRITFYLSPEDLGLVDANGQESQLPGNVRIYIGGGQPDFNDGNKGVSGVIRFIGETRFLP